MFSLCKMLFSDRKARRFACAFRAEGRLKAVIEYSFSPTQCHAVDSLPLQFKSQELEVAAVPFPVQLLYQLSYHVIPHWNPQLCLHPDKKAIGLDLLPKVISFITINKKRNTAFSVGPNNTEMQILL